jgi:hypothetical protein
MRGFSLFLLLAALALPAEAEKPANPKSDSPKQVTVNQLEQSLSQTQGKTDAEMALALSGLELTERVGAARFAHLSANLPGEKSQQELLILADRAALLAPPEDETVADPTPDAATMRQMLVKIVNYVNTTVRQLPNLMAVRETTGFEDRPEEDRLESTGVVSLSYLPLRATGKSSIAVSYRDRKEVVDESATKALKHPAPIEGLITSGLFGPILSTVLADALKGKITWARWERDADKRLAVFYYAVPGEKSNYDVRFCCVVKGLRSVGQADVGVFDERASYHGDIVFDPADGSILRITMEAEMPPKGLVPSAGVAIEYGPVEIGGRSYICPTRSVSLLTAHTAAQQGMFSQSNYRGAATTFLNDVKFTQYRRFGSETRILTGDSSAPPQ